MKITPMRPDWKASLARDMRRSAGRVRKRETYVQAKASDEFERESSLLFHGRHVRDAQMQEDGDQAVEGDAVQRDQRVHQQVDVRLRREDVAEARRRLRLRLAVTAKERLLRAVVVGLLCSAAAAARQGAPEDAAVVAVVLLGLQGFLQLSQAPAPGSER